MLTPVAEGADALSMDSVETVLMEVSPAVLGRHLSWLVDQSHMVPQASERRILIEDQAGILIGALDRRGHYAVVVEALRDPWVDAPQDCDDEVIVYAGRLATLTMGQPAYSPYVTLARNAAKVAALVQRLADRSELAS